MLNTDNFITRLEILMEKNQLSAAAFAERIGVQRSSVSHILSKRNKPSLDFFLKIKERYPETDLNWIISGKKTKLTKKTKTKSNEIESVIILYKDGTFKKN